jgi:hypothetical protein
LAGIYDTKDNNVFDVGKFFRVVYTGTNVSNTSTGLGLSPIAVDLTNFSGPASNQIYIDPKLGKFVLPRPVYWSRCESLNDITTAAEIGSATYTLSGYGYTLFNNGGLYNSNYMETKPYSASYNHYGVSDIQVNNTSSLSQGSISCLVNMWYIAQYNGVFQIRINNNVTVSLSTSIYGTNNNININGTTISNSNFNLFNNWNHVFITWGTTYGVKVYVNGVLEIDNNTTFTKDSNNIDINMQGFDNDYGITAVDIDNIKVWNGLLDPAIANTMATTVEDALHQIYGSANNYKPSSDIKVWFYY